MFQMYSEAQDESLAIILLLLIQKHIVMPVWHLLQQANTVYKIFFYVYYLHGTEHFTDD